MITLYLYLGTFGIRTSSQHRMLQSAKRIIKWSYFTLSYKSEVSRVMRWTAGKQRANKCGRICLWTEALDRCIRKSLIKTNCTNQSGPQCRRTPQLLLLREYAAEPTLTNADLGNVGVPCTSVPGIILAWRFRRLRNPNTQTQAQFPNGNRE